MTKKKPPAITDADMVALERMTQIAMLNTKQGDVIDFAKMLKNTSYATITDGMREALSELVKGKRVFDLGAGDLSTSHLLAELGASEVHAIEKDVTHQPKSPKVIQYPMLFRQFIHLKECMPREDDVGFISWPANHVMDGLLELLYHCGTVIYIGKNTDGTACGWPGFFGYLLSRGVIYYLPNQKNCLIAYGKQVSGPPRRVFGEEWAGIDHSEEHSFDESEIRFRPL